MTLEENLNYVKSNCTYIKIPDGNKIGNGSPGLKSSDPIALNKYIFMESIIIYPNTESEKTLLENLLKKMKISFEKKQDDQIILTEEWFMRQLCLPIYILD